MGRVVPFPRRSSTDPLNVSDIEAALEEARRPFDIQERLESLDSLVVFSPEIALPPPAPRRAHDSARVEWGDVFLRTGDEYPFIFTLYTRRFVSSFYLQRGERICPSPHDIILDRPGLGPPDILRAMIKWVDRYHPDLRGLPIELERREVVEGLVCDPGEEIVVLDHPGLFSL